MAGVGTDDAGNGVTLTMAQFLGYCGSTDDPNPMYLFQHIGYCAQREPSGHGSVNRRAGVVDPSAALQTEYQVPALFQDDLLALLPDELRPPYRWVALYQEAAVSVGPVIA